MPVTAKLSLKFYETFGEDVTNELVDWLNSVDSTYRADLRELNEVNFQRFDAKLEQRLAELKAELQTQIAQGLAAVETRIVRWMFTFWVPTAVGIIATAISVVALLLRR
ncbi:MAG: hypothetical protein ACREMC_07775 [Gemmatimonadales bacterium]